MPADQGTSCRRTDSEQLKLFVEFQPVVDPGARIFWFGFGARVDDDIQDRIQRRRRLKDPTDLGFRVEPKVGLAVGTVVERVRRDNDPKGEKPAQKNLLFRATLSPGFARSLIAGIRVARWGSVIGFLNKANLVVLLLLGLLAFGVVSAPALGVIAFATVIGIPLAYLYWAIPGIFLYYLIFTVLTFVLPFRRTLAVPLAVALSFAVMMSAALVINHRIKAEVAALRAGDVRAVSLPLDTKVIAYRSDGETCDAFCLNALLSGAADRFLVARWEPVGSDLDTAQIVKSFQFTRHDTCAPLSEIDVSRTPAFEMYRDVNNGPEAISIRQRLTLELAQGNCLIQGAAPLGEADTIISNGALRKARSVRKSGFHSGIDGIESRRISVHQRNDRTGSFDETYRQTDGKYRLAVAPLMSGPVFGYGLDANVGWFWTTQYFIRSRFEDRDRFADFITKTLELDLTIPEFRPAPVVQVPTAGAPAAPGQDVPAVSDPPGQTPADASQTDAYRASIQDMMETVVRSGDLPTQAQWSAFEAYWDKLALNRRADFAVAPDDRDIAIGLSLLVNPFLPAPPEMQSFVGELRKQAHVTDAALAQMLFDRIAQTEPWQEPEERHVQKWRWVSFIRALEALYALPPELLLDFYDDMLRAAANREVYNPDNPVMARFYLFGEDGVAPLLDMVTVGLRTRNHARYNIGLSGLCHLPPLTDDQKEQLVAAINTSLVGAHNTFNRLMVTQLIKDGFTAESLWPLIDNREFRNFEKQDLIEKFQDPRYSTIKSCD